MIGAIVRLLGSRFTILMGVVLGTLLLGSLIVHAIKQNAVQREKQEQLLFRLEMFKVQTEQMSKVAYETQKQIQILSEQNAKLVEQYDEISNLKPLPDTCVLDNGRLSIINKAISNATNTKN